MAVPTSRQEFKDYCLRRLGAPVIDINVDNEQVEDRVDDALRFYQDYHYDGTENILYRHPVVQADIDNRYITLPQSIIGVRRILDIGLAIQTNNIFSLRYQIHLNDLFDISASSYVPYYMALQHIEMIEELFVGKKPIRYSRHNNILHIDMDWPADVRPGEWIIVEAYAIIDPETYADVWADWWLQKYATALIKKQWGSNLSKFEGMQLPGAVTFNGGKILDEADAEIQKLEEEMINNFSLPVTDFIA